jgi:hypothetical protein
VHGTGVEPAQREAGGLQPLGLTSDQAHAQGDQGDSNPPSPGPQPGVLPLHHEHHGVPLGGRCTLSRSRTGGLPLRRRALCPLSYEGGKNTLRRLDSNQHYAGNNRGSCRWMTPDQWRRWDSNPRSSGCTSHSGGCCTFPGTQEGTRVQGPGGSGWDRPAASSISGAGTFRHPSRSVQ